MCQSSGELSCELALKVKWILVMETKLDELINQQETKDNRK
jgi:hypothetical protein